MPRPLCLIMGFGEGVGAALARSFLAAGYDLALLSRSGRGLDETELGEGRQHVVACDIADTDALGSVLERIEQEAGPVDTLLYNADTGAFGDLDAISEADFEQAWRINVMGLFVAAKALSPGMVARGTGNIIISGATASLRGNPGTVAFAPAKSGQRALAQSLAKQLGPKGVHVALMVIDAVVDTPRNLSGMFAGNPREFFVSAEQIAATALQLARQDRSAWTFELDLRPFAENW